MRKTTYTYLTYMAALLLLPLASCTDTGFREYAEEAGDVRRQVDVRCFISDSPSRQTRAIYEGTEFDYGETIGLFICQNKSYEAQNTGNNNMCATWCASGDCEGLAADGWAYSNSGSTDKFPALFVADNDSHTPADFYAYAPFISGVGTKVNSIPFSMSDQRDLMYAVQNASGDNKGIDPKQGSGTLQVKFNFRHVMAHLRIGIKKAYDNGDVLKLTSIELRRGASADASRKIVTSGRFDATTGTFPTLTRSESFKYSGYSGTYTFGTRTLNTASYEYIDMVVYPDELLASGDAELVFYLDENTSTPAGSINGIGVDGAQVYPIQMEDLLHDDGTTQGFRAGYRYNINLTLDNYIHIMHRDESCVDVLDIKEEWEATDISIMI